MRAFTLAIGTLILTTWPSFADWQYTRWGMTPDEVVAASNGAASKPQIAPPKKGRAVDDETVKGTYETPSFKFSVGFVFENDKLAAVRLKPMPIDKIYDVGSQLASIYGKPIYDRDERTSGGICFLTNRKWRDEKAGNEISYSSYACIKTNISNKSLIGGVSYTPIRSSKSTGL